VLRDSSLHFKDLIKDNEDLLKKSKSINRKLEFVNHLRNKICGHLDQNLLIKAAQWEPQIFRTEINDNKEIQLSLAYKTLIESGINSFIDNESNQKVFNTKIDLFLPHNQRMFFNYIDELNKNTIDFLSSIITLLENQLEFWDDIKLMEMARKAGKTDFRLG
jgi:hypothetical protein